MDDQVKIWHRVKAEAQAVTEGVPGLAATALAQAALYSALARQMQGPAKNILLTLQEEQQHCARCLKGIYRMATGNPMKPAVVPPSAENREAALRKCYAQSLKNLAVYDSRAFHPEYGPVFTHLAAKTREACCALVELMGF